jgi:putative salt-induced outer membrane protein
MVFASARAAEQPVADETGPSAETATLKETTRKSQWNGAAELGFLMTRGNTQTESLNLAARLENTRLKWHHKVEFKALQASEQSATTAESYEATGRTEYLLDDNDYLFGSLRYQDDRFSGYDRRTTEVLGYGHQYLKRPDMKLKGEFGVGARQTDNTDNTRSDEGILRVGLNYSWEITKTSSFKEDIFVEHGEENTATESVTELTVKINSKLAMKLGVTVKDNSNPPVGIKNTDTKTAVTLVYDF